MGACVDPRGPPGLNFKALGELAREVALRGICWTGGRVVEGTGLENRRTGNGIVSSNLTLSVPALGRVAEWFKAQAWKACVR